jgi:hypothetical protein
MMRFEPTSISTRSLGVFVGTVFAGAFAFGIGFDVGVTKFYDAWNKGVRNTQSHHACNLIEGSMHSRNNGKISAIDMSQKIRTLC